MALPDRPPIKRTHTMQGKSTPSFGGQISKVYSGAAWRREKTLTWGQNECDKEHRWDGGPRYKNYTPHEGPSLVNDTSRKLGVFGRKLEGSHSPFNHYFGKYFMKQ